MRRYAQIQLDIWNNDDFRALSPAAQHLYFILLSLPSLTHAGVGDWRPGRIARLAAGWSRQEVERAAGELIAGLFILVDEDTEEYLIRSFVRNDPLMKQPNMATAMARRLAEVASPELHGVVVFELKRLREECPDLAGWSSGDALGLLRRGSVNPSEYPLGKGSVNPSEKGSVNPSSGGIEKGSVNPFPNPSEKGSSKGSIKGCPTPAPATNTYTPAPREVAEEPITPARKGTRLPTDWSPTPGVDEAMRDDYPHVDHDHELEKFRDYWTAKTGQGATKLDWNATWRNWIRRAAEHQPTSTTDTGRGYHPSDWLNASGGPQVIDADSIEVGEEPPWMTGS